MNEERAVKCLRQVEHIRRHLCLMFAAALFQADHFIFI